MNILTVLSVMALLILKHDWNTNSCKEKVWLISGFSLATMKFLAVHIYLGYGSTHIYLNQLSS